MNPATRRFGRLELAGPDGPRRVFVELRQDGTTRDMIFPIADVIAYASQVMTLEPGDLLLTGTPSGVGPLSAGDALCITIQPIGALRLAVTGPPSER